jgi:hypothetical protein
MQPAANVCAPLNTMAKLWQVAAATTLLRLGFSQGLVTLAVCHLHRLTLALAERCGGDSCGGGDLLAVRLADLHTADRNMV